LRTYQACFTALPRGRPKTRLDFPKMTGDRRKSVNFRRCQVIAWVSCRLLSVLRSRSARTFSAPAGDSRSGAHFPLAAVMQFCAAWREVRDFKERPRSEATEETPHTPGADAVSGRIVAYVDISTIRQFWPGWQAGRARIRAQRRKGAKTQRLGGGWSEARGREERDEVAV
jgi:hypothetical protein